MKPLLFAFRPYGPGIFGLLLLLLTASQGQAKIRVTGTVTDEGGSTLPGISVVISGAGKGSIVNNATNRVTNTRGGYDGSPVVVTIGQSRLVDINPQDIDRIEVLNRAAAPAI